MNVYPKLFLKPIIECFDNHPPESIIVGGSYSTGEACRIQYNGSELWLSDFDLLCISNRKYSHDESRNIYERMWKLSKQLPQSNPYFHIGIKLRSPIELKNEVDSMYFKELREMGLVIKGNSLNAYIGNSDDAGFHMLGKRVLHKKLYNWGVSRLWCNILFFPINLILDPSSVKENIWYSYFVARGALDWITWQLIEANLWAPSYKKRFEIWQSEFNIPKQMLLLLRQCLNVRLGKTMIDIKEIFPVVLSFSLEQIERYKILSFGNSEDKELTFVKSMLHVIRTSINGDNDFSPLVEAKLLLEKMSRDNVDTTGNFSWEYWHKLRVAYSKFRFQCNPIDRKDHNVYTERFLSLGAPVNYTCSVQEA